ncbi:MAG: hypothetical protein ACLFQM_05550 [Fidelibacterota bacterium]
MTTKKRDFLNFEKPEDKKVNFRNLRRKRPTKKLWLILLMIIALSYLVYVLRLSY